MHYRHKEARGFTLLIALLLGSLALAVGFAIFSLTFKEITLAAAGKESVRALYAANSAVECALYWDQQIDAFAPGAPLPSIACGGNSFNVATSTVGSTAVREVALDFDNESLCAVVIVTKSGSPIRTVIEARGYNTCLSENPRISERALRVSY